MMIEINLLPEELKKKISIRKIEIGEKTKYLLSLIPLIFLLLICVHISLAAVTIFRSNKLRILRNRWKSQEPQRQVLNEFRREYAMVTEDSLAIQRLTEERINWSEKLNKLSLNLPSGIWFNEISATPGDLTIKGSAVSLQEEEMALIKKLIDNLKNDKAFFRDFNKIELSSVRSRQIADYEVLDFILVGTINPDRNVRPPVKNVKPQETRGKILAR